MEEERPSIYRVSRTIKRRENTLYNALRSIYEDSIFVGEISELWPDLPLLANLRCGLWYSSKFHSTCYFKSTDGHTNNWSFSTSRLNLHVALLAGQKGGCIIVDSTRRGKRFPDSMSKTIPIWACVLNRAVLNYKNRMHEMGVLLEGDSYTSSSNKHAEATSHLSYDWDCSLHLPLWVSRTEKASIEDRLGVWTQQLEASGADIASIASLLRKPLRPLWISQRTVIWLNEVPDYESWDFTPIILVSASSSNGTVQHRLTSEFSWNYIPGAGDDEESWARSLSPSLFWQHAFDLINSGPDLCNQKVADIIEKDRVYCAYRGEDAPQVLARPGKMSVPTSHFEFEDPPLPLGSSNLRTDCSEISWLGSTNLAVSTTQMAADADTSNLDCILNCDKGQISTCISYSEAYLHLPIVNSKFDRFSLLNNLPAVLRFAKLNLSNRKRLLVCCNDGEDISICVCLAIFTSLFDDVGTFDDGKSFGEKSITKWGMRRRLVYICKYAVNARPSRGNLKQVFRFLGGGRVDSGS